MPVRDIGLDALFADLSGEASGVVVTEHENDSEAARYLQAREGYRVYNDGALADIHTDAIRRLASGDDPLTREAVIENQTEAARRAVGFHRAYTGRTKKPLYAGGPRRPVREGAWADRSGDTAGRDDTSGYQAFVEGRRVTGLPQPEGQRLTRTAD